MSALREILASFSIEVDDHALKEAHAGIGSMIERLGAFGAAAAAAFAVKEIYEFVHGLTEQAESIEQTSEALGLSTKELQEWQGAANMAGVQTGSLDTAFRMMAKNLGKGAGPGVDALQRLGVQVHDAAGQVRPLGDLFEDAGGAIGGIENAGQRAAIGTEIFGRGFQKIIPLISRGREGMASLRAEVEELGGGFSEDFIAKSKEVNEEAQKLNIIWTTLKVTVAAGLLPVMQWLTRGFVEVARPILDLLKHTEAVKAAMLVLGAIGATALGPFIAEFAALAVAALPIAALFLLVEDFATFLKGGDSETGRLIDFLFGKGAAASFRQFVLHLTSSWENFGNVMKAIAGYISLAFENGWGDVKFFGLHTAAELKDVFDDLWAGVLSGAATALDLIPGMADKVKELRAEVQTLRDHSAHGGSAKEVDDLDDERKKDQTARADAYIAEIRGVRRPVSFHRDTPDEQKAEAAAARKGGSSHVENHTHTTVNIHLPHGTPAQTVQRIGAAAAQGANQGANSARSTHAALNPGKG